MSTIQISLRAGQRIFVNGAVIRADRKVTLELLNDATFLLATAQLEIQAWNDAKTTLRAFIRRFPKSARLNEARSKLAETELFH